MSPRLAYPALALLGLLTAASLGGCESSFVGTLDLTISGVPLTGTQNVVLAITGVELGGDGGQTSLNVSPELNVELDSGDRITVMDSLVPVGDYKWVRLDIDPTNSYVIASNGDRYPLKVSSVYQATAPFTVGEGLSSNMLVNIDLRRALDVGIQGSTPVYTLQPISQLVDLASVSNIVGTIPVSLTIGSLPVTDPACDPEVYAYPGAGAVPEGFFVPVKGATAPFTSADTVLHVTDGFYTYDAILLPPGTYTVAVTCAAADVPGSKSIAFSPTQTAVVTLGKSAVADF